MSKAYALVDETTGKADVVDLLAADKANVSIVFEGLRSLHVPLYTQQVYRCEGARPSHTAVGPL